MLYTTFLNAIIALLTVVYTNIANNGCTTLYCACAHQYYARLLGSKVQIIEGSDTLRFR